MGMAIPASYKSWFTRMREPLAFGILFFFILSAQIQLAAAAPHKGAIQLHRRSLFEQSSVLDDTKPILSRTCRVGIYQNNENIYKRKPNDIDWEGFPLGQGYNFSARTADIAFYEAENPPCNVIKDTLGDGIATAGAKFVWAQGYCGCGFWFISNCTGDFSYAEPERFATIDPYELDIRDNNDGGSHPGTFSSFRCITSTGWRPYSSCEVSFTNGGDQNEKFNEFDGTRRTLAVFKSFTDAGSWDALRPGPTVINRYTGQGSCIPVSDELPDADGVVMRQWKIKDCTCNFWTNSNCEGNPYLIDGVRGSVSRDRTNDNVYVFSRAQQVRSFRCDAPYGPSLG
ncbi:hypothetical protein TWF481_007518 [Arthrobotrys musiformis]|uniref:Uncharacterized protein n=1 Tax=Arthrobotrys musiformis TaxID=47236 RepID=A0AAV9WBW4_9PEZI